MSFSRNSKMFNNKNINEKILEVVKDYNEAQNLACSLNSNEVDTLYGKMVNHKMQKVMLKRYMIWI